MLCLLDFAVVAADTSRFLFLFDIALHCPGELIIVGYHKHSIVQNDSIQNPKRLRRKHEFPVQLGNIDGCSKLFAARRKDTVYILFDVKRGGA